MPNFMFVINYVGDNNNCIMYEVSKRLDISYSHTVKVINSLKEEGYLLTNKSGRVVKLSLTSKGWKLFRPIKEIMGVMEITRLNDGKYRYKGNVQDES